MKKLSRELVPEDIRTFNEILLISNSFKFWDSINEPELNLFYWCVLSKRIEMAKLFWRFGKVSSPNNIV